MEETRNVIIGGIKGFERLLTLSKDRSNPKWKPLHMAGSWNSRNRRMAKLRARDNWFKGSQEVEPREEMMAGEPRESSRRLDSPQVGSSTSYRPSGFQKDGWHQG